jgi:DNA-binding transcriptional LysR family regulator
LPARFVQATGYAEQLVTRELPFPMDPVSVQMLWPLRLDADAGQRWLREHIQRVTAGESG